MTITVKNFALLVAYVQCMVNRGGPVAVYEIDDLLKIVESFQEPISTEPAKVDLRPLFNAICEDKNIEAIKCYHNLTGFGLKESKDEIERLMNILNEQD